MKIDDVIVRPQSKRSVLIAGISTRAAAESAARAGHDVVAIDAFADLDQHPSVRALSLPRDFGRSFSPRAAADAARGLPGQAAVYLSSFENDPGAVRVLADGRALWGNTPDVLRRVRNPQTLSEIFCGAGFGTPGVVHARDRRRAGPPDAQRRWLIKPLASGGGHGVRRWTPGQPVARRHYLQEFVDGVPGSVVFVAAGGCAVPLGVTRQLVGEAPFGAFGFRYCGNVLIPCRGRSLGAGADELLDAVISLTAAAARTFDLVGLCGIDFIAREASPVPIELNPRWSSSMELVERAWGLSMFAIHVDACTRGALPAFELRNALATDVAHGKAIVFARQDLVAGDTQGWLVDPDVRDVPRSGERIAAGQPICTVFASGPDESACHAMLVRRAQEIYARVAASGK